MAKRGWGMVIRKKTRSLLEFSRRYRLLTQSILALWSAASIGVLTPIASAEEPVIRADAMRAETRFLADDLLEGRGTGARGYDIAAAYVASKFEGMGLSPAGSKGAGYFQQVPLRSMSVDQSTVSVMFSKGRDHEEFKFGEDYLPWADPGRNHSSVRGEVVFVGYGVSAPDLHYDDYRGLDVRGKIVVYVDDAPKQFDSALHAYYQNVYVKDKTAAAHGAIAAIKIQDPKWEKEYPFDMRIRNLEIPALRWLDEAGKPDHYIEQIRAHVSLSVAGTHKLLVHGPHSPEQIYAAAKAGQPLHFASGFKAEIRIDTRFSDARSSNVIGTIEGSDPQLRKQFVIYSAHLDHLGIGPPVDGDAIYNGAMDNAAGVAALIEIAAAHTMLQRRSRRSILFLATTGEEAGLLGAGYFANNPTIPRDSVIANINIDGSVNPWPGMRDVIAFGAEHSTLSQPVQHAADRMGVLNSPDPMPDEVLFIRSDQYAFVEAGIPSVFLSPGFESSDPNLDTMKIFITWIGKHYHQPSDDMQSTDIDFEAGAKFAQFAFLCGLEVADNVDRPRWNAGDPFERLFPRMR